MNQEGYHICVWHKSKNRLEEPDKWQSGSSAAQIYAFFKRHGAVDPAQRGADRIVAFGPSVEKTELKRECRDQQLLGRSPGLAQACRAERAER